MATAGFGVDKFGASAFGSNPTRDITLHVGPMTTRHIKAGHARARHTDATPIRS